MAVNASCPPPAPAPGVPPGRVSLPLGTDALLVLGALGWLVWDRLLRQRLMTRLDGVFAPIEEERRLNALVAQVGVVTGASRVVLCAFHNGAIDTSGYHLVKVSTINSYVAAGAVPMVDTIRDLPVGRIMNEIERMMRLQREGDDRWDLITNNEGLPQACRDHLKRNSIDTMYNRLVRVGTLPIGILSLQYQEGERRRPPLGDDLHASLVDDLYDQIALIMRRRIVSPGPFKRLLTSLQGGVAKRSSR